MTQAYNEVRVEDFMKIGGGKLPHILIELRLISLGRELGNGGAFKKEVLKLAGWTGSSLTTYASRAEVAALAFNRIRDVLSQGVKNADELTQKLSTSQLTVKK
ncbi:MAG: hypothetical protein ACI8VC_000648 [Candidatus Endobugula sp.]